MLSRVCNTFRVIILFWSHPHQIFYTILTVLFFAHFCIKYLYELIACLHLAFCLSDCLDYTTSSIIIIIPFSFVFLRLLLLQTETVALWRYAYIHIRSLLFFLLPKESYCNVVSAVQLQLLLCFYYIAFLALSFGCCCMQK